MRIKLAMREKCLMINDMEQVNFIFKTDALIKEIGNMVKWMDMALYFHKITKLFIQANGKMINFMEKEFQRINPLNNQTDRLIIGILI